VADQKIFTLHSMVREGTSGKTSNGFSSQLRLTTFFGSGKNNDDILGNNQSADIFSKKNDNVAGIIPPSLSVRKRRLDGSRFGVCPLCHQSVALYKLEAHAAQCYGPEENKKKIVKISSPPTRRASQKENPAALESSIYTSQSSREEKEVPPMSSLSESLPYFEPLPGLFVFERVISRGDEAALLHMLDFEDVLPWKLSRFNGISYGKRWGVHCNLRDRRVDSPQHPLPQAVQNFIQTTLSRVKASLKTKNSNLKDFQPNEANAIDYRRREKHWLKAHVDDRQLSKEPIVNLSLAGDCIMTFRNQKRTPAHQQQRPEEYRLLLKRGTLQLLTGSARYDYSHEIGNADLLSDRRVSITMRESPLTIASTETDPSALKRQSAQLSHYAWRSNPPIKSKR
jgi:alkylated DNA repair dioxygenase AlkB